MEDSKLLTWGVASITVDGTRHGFYFATLETCSFSAAATLAAATKAISAKATSAGRGASNSLSLRSGILEINVLPLSRKRLWEDRAGLARGRWRPMSPEEGTLAP